MARFHTLTRAFSVVAATSLTVGLAACSDDNEEDVTEETTSSSEAPTTEAEPTFETGGYRGEPAKGWPDPLDDDLGKISASYELADNVLLPMEIDDKLYHSSIGGQVIKLEHASRIFNDAVGEAIKPMSENYLYGFQSSAHDNAPTKRNATHMVLRFNNPDAAQEVAEAIRSTALTQGTTLTFDDQTFPEQPYYIEGLPESMTTTVTTETRKEVHTLTTHNEYLIITSTGDGGEKFAESDWHDEYHTDYVEEQITLLDGIKAKKTKDGFGEADQWPSLDPDNILRLTIPPEEGEEFLGSVGAFGTRYSASQFTDAKTAWSTLEQAGVERTGWNITQLYRTKNAEAPQVIQSWMRSSAAEGEITDYEEPQGVPNTKCHSSDQESYVEYTCFLIFDNYLAYSSTEDYYDKPEDDDAKERLSHRMAAQYLSLKKAADE